ncbi:hypothetical protein ACLOJK_011350 [Asimina triloba]
MPAPPPTSPACPFLTFFLPLFLLLVSISFLIVTMDEENGLVTSRRDWHGALSKAICLLPEGVLETTTIKWQHRTADYQRSMKFPFYPVISIPARKFVSVPSFPPRHSEERVMDLDIPLPEELEWLESNALVPEEEDFDDFYPEEELPEPSHTISDLPAPENPNWRKRTLKGDDQEPLEPLKRTKTHAEAEIDEDWLRYSPPKDSGHDEAANPAEKENVVPEVAEERVIYRFASEIDGGCFPVTGPSGGRVYAKMVSGEMSRDWKASRIERPLSGSWDEVLCLTRTRDDQQEGQPEPEKNPLERYLRGYCNFTKVRGLCGLISEPINVLMERVDQEAFKKVLESSNHSIDDSIHPTAPVISEQLWVDKYSPSSFTELLSDEQTNREVLLWLKQWDSYVFGSQIRATADDVLSALRRHSLLSQQQKFSESRRPFNKNRGAPFGNQISKQPNGLSQVDANANSISELWNKNIITSNSLEHKVLLLCGPPGLGKTTLAHVAAKHCGYRVVEINASDDRSSSVIESKILDAVQMNSVLADSKPNCLVIDEIDGALADGKGAVEVILKMASQITVQFVLAVKSILANYFLISSQITSKFYPHCMSISCTTEKMYCSLILLSVAEEVHSRKASLRKGRKATTLSRPLEVGSQVVGRKDMSKGVLDVWKEVFQKKKVKHQRKFSNTSASVPKDIDILGDCELTMDGIHENLLQLHYHDPMMRKTVKCLSGLGDSDSISRYAMKTQQMSLYGGAPSLSLHRAMLMEKKDALKVWANKMPPSISRHLTVESFAEDAVALHLLSEKEKYDLAQLVDTMVSYSITYKNLKSEPQASAQKKEATSDTSALSFDPPISDFVNFKGYNCGHLGLSLAMKQVLVHEVEKQRILRESIGKPAHPNDENRVSSMEWGVKPSFTTVSVQNNAENHKSISTENPWKVKAASNSTSRPSDSTPMGVKLKAPRDSKRPTGGSFDFFDRFRKPVSKSSQNPEDVLQKSATLERDLRPLLFKYNENASSRCKEHPGWGGCSNYNLMA